MFLLLPVALALPPESAAWVLLDEAPYRVECARVGEATWCRGHARASVGVDALARVIEDRANYTRHYEHVARSEILGADVFRIELDLPPLIGDRDWVVRAWRAEEGASRLYRWIHTELPEAPPVEGVLRLGLAEGEWRLSPEAGGTSLRYTWQADFGGNLPGWILNRIRVDTAAEMLGGTIRSAGG